MDKKFDSLEREETSSCTNNCIKKRITVSRGKHAVSYDVHSLAVEVSCYGGHENLVDAETKRADRESSIKHKADESSGDADGTSALGGPGNRGTEGKTTVVKHVCEYDTLHSGTRSGT